jgi:hypothetical protein
MTCQHCHGELTAKNTLAYYDAMEMDQVVEKVVNK